MRGHVQIREMRRSGYKPRMVFIWDMDVLPTGYFVDAEMTTELGTDAEIHICRSEPIESLDMRFLVGLDTQVLSTDLNRLRALYASLKACKVKSIVASNGSDILFVKEFG